MAELLGMDWLDLKAANETDPMRDEWDEWNWLDMPQIKI